ncbi:sigma-54 dependent transcriptional regulator [Castellaniella sp. MT123]|uniref:sigma-54-dependent transcriptional regulator n=1 Tax=Castellaniella sp. MT123 TaxID=3140381 RepID=UPI0031F355F4
MSSVDVVFVDDDEDVRDANTQALDLQGVVVHPCAGAREALDYLTPDFPGVLVTDVRMADMDGLTLFRHVRRLDADIPVILITGHGDIEMAVGAMREGAYDFLSKPYAPERLLAAIRHGAAQRHLVLENRRLRAQAAQVPDAASMLIGNAPAIVRIRELLRHVADADVDVLVHGETGSGKEVVAQVLHRLSRRRDGPFVAINCGALPESVIESELFGHEAGAFTGAQKRRVGRIEHADGGTLFLDEIESMSAAMQVRMLRVLETRQVMPLGTNEHRAVDVRVVAATKTDLGAPEIRSRFREDLYYRLNVVTVEIPPLRARREDIPVLFTHFAARAAQRFNCPVPPVDPVFWRHLMRHDWPGNVRELAHAADRYVLGVHRIADEGGSQADEPAGSLPERVDHYEAELIREALAAHGGEIKATLAALGLPRKTLYDKLRRYGIDRQAFARPGLPDDAGVGDQPDEAGA